jgi:ATP-binding cassette subfamily C protein LapB
MKALIQLFKSLWNGTRSKELIASTAAINALGLASSLYSIHLMNRYVSVGLTPTLVTLTVGVLVAIAFESLIRKMRSRVLDGFGAEEESALSARVLRAFAGSRYESLLGIDLSLRREAQGAPAARQQLYSSSNLSAVLDFPFAVLYIAAAFLLYWPFGILTLLAGCGAIQRGIHGERAQRESAATHAKANSRALQMGQFLLACGEALRGLPMQALFARRWTAVQGDSLSSRRDGMALQAGVQYGTQTIGSLLTVAVYAFGAVAVVRGDLSAGALIGANIIASRAFAICSRSAALADPVVRAARAEAALVQIEQAEADTQQGLAPAALSGRFELVDVAFAYPQQPMPLFERLSIHLAPGQVLVVKGPNGAGKSTLTRMMLGLLQPQRGLVRADGIELRQFSAQWLRGQIGYAPQEPAFFDGTLRENLLLDRAISDEALLEAVRDMDLAGYLATDPQGLDRAVNSHESTMAVGIRRRFSLLRAVLGNPPLVFLDDPTEGLDAQGMAAVARLLNRLVSRGTTLVIASNEGFIQQAADFVVDLGQKPEPAVQAIPRKMEKAA